MIKTARSIVFVMTSAQPEAGMPPSMPTSKLLKTLLVLLVAVVIPVTVVVLQQQQQVEQQAQTSGPTVSQIAIQNAGVYYAGDNRNMTVSITGTGAQYRVYMHGASQPSTSDPLPVQSYNPNSSLQANTAYFIGLFQSGQTLNFVPPTTPATYYLLVNAESAPDGTGKRIGCSWADQRYERDGAGNVSNIAAVGTCTNASPTTVQTYKSSVSSITVPVTIAPGQTISVNITGGTNKYWMYIHSGPNTPQRNDPVVQSYNPGGPFNPNTFYRFAYVGVSSSSSGGSTNLTLPTRLGTYYLVANAHANLQEGLPWHAYDRTCAWDSRMYLYNSSGTVDIGIPCSNSGPVQINLATPTNTPTPTRTPTQVPSATPTITPTPTLPSPTPTNTPVPGNTYMTVYLLLHGIGAAGDSVNPYGPGNLNPVTVSKPVTLQFLDTNDALVAEKTGTVTYDPGPGRFAGTIDVTGLIAGTYKIKVKTERYLRKKWPNMQQILVDQVTQMPQIELVVGDANNDNALNILDYNILLDCWSDLAPPIACDDPAKKLSVDFDDNGSVNQYDYNLFNREISVVQFGD
jgi:hypothetical protein